MDALSHDPQVLAWISALGWTLLHVLWQGALVGAAYGFARWLIGPAHAQLRYAVGLIALGVLAVLPVITFLSLAPWSAVAGGDSAIALSSVVASVGAAGTASGFALEPWLPWIVAAWSLGVALHSLRATFQYWRLRRLCRLEAQPLPEWEATLKHLAQRFGVTRPVRLVRSAIVQTPSLIGWIAPIIMLPAGVLVGLTPQQIELVIAHELGHIRRWDYAVNLLQIALETVLFYHPVVHWISREVRNDREACCDDLVLRLGANPVDYATTLASLEDLRGFTHAPAVAATGGFLLGRIRRIVHADPHFAQPITGGQSLMVLAIAGAVLMAAQPFTRTVLGDLIDRDVRVAYDGAVGTTTSTLAKAAILSVQRVMQTATTTPVPAATVEPAAPEVPAAVQKVAEPVAAPIVSAPRIALALASTNAPRIETRVDATDIVTGLSVPMLAPATVAPDAGSLRAVRTAAPVFPRQAAIDGVEGQVTLSFYVDASGRATQIAVVGATVPETFDAAAIAALREWRFAEDDTRRNRRFQQTFDFTLTANAAPPTTDECLTPLGTRICRRSLNEVGAVRRDVIEDPAESARSEWLRVSQKR